jgi:hypothetical protein
MACETVGDDMDKYRCMNMYRMLFIIHTKAGIAGAPPDASEDEPRGYRDTKSREYYTVKWDIYSIQSYRCNKRKKEAAEPKNGSD